MKSSRKSIVAYYSRHGETFFNSGVITVQVGNTEVVAKKIQNLTGSDIFQIDTVNSYPYEFKETVEIAKQELKEQFRPELTAIVDNMEQYKIVYLGYPIWWDTYPMAVATFLDSYNFDDKIIIPFCTHSGSAFGRSELDIMKAAPNATVLNGLSLRGENVYYADKEIAAWLKNKIAL